MNQTAGDDDARPDDAVEARAEHPKAPWVTPRLTIGSVAVRTEACRFPSTVEYTSSKLGS